MSKINELREYIDELHSRIDYEDYLNLRDYLNKVEMILTCKEDFREWVIDNWFEVEDSIGKSILIMKGTNLEDDTERDNLTEFISEKIKEGLLNVVDTYEVEE